MVRVCLLDTSLASLNLGDQIIVDSCMPFISKNCEIVSVLPTHRLPNSEEYRAANTLGPDVMLFLGTNVLSGNAFRLKQWPVNRRLRNFIAGRTVMMGVGWWSDQSSEFTSQTLKFYREIAMRGVPWSVRDLATLHKMESIGVEAVFTGCPTTWNLSNFSTPVAGAKIVSTLTSYRRNRKVDREWVKSLMSQCEVFWWPQSVADTSYMVSIGVPRERILSVDVRVLRHVLLNWAEGYLGTRLHAGILALQLGVPTAVIQVDNRTRELGQDQSIPTVLRDSEEIAKLLGNPKSGSIFVPETQINSWLEQLRNWKAG